MLRTVLSFCDEALREAEHGNSSAGVERGSAPTNCKRRAADGAGWGQMAHFVANRCPTSYTIEERGGGLWPILPSFRLSYLLSSTLCRRLHFGGRGVLLAVWIRAEVLFDP